MSDTDPVVIVGMARTPMGGLLGDLSAMSANELGAIAVKAAVEEAKLGADEADEIIMGNCLPAGQGQAPARQAGFKAGMDKGLEATTINKMCGSGLQAAVMGRQSIAAGRCQYCHCRRHGKHDQCAASHGCPQGAQIWRHGRQGSYGAGRPDRRLCRRPNGRVRRHDRREVPVHPRAAGCLRAGNPEAARKNATESGKFKREIAPVTIKSRKGETTVDTDELPRTARPDKIPSLRPAFNKDGTVTAANASAISDGAAALVLMKESEAASRGLSPIAKIISSSSHAHEPENFTTAPVPAMEKALTKAGWSKDEVDLWEINEAFAVVPMIAMKELGLSHDKVNVNGGACAMGHPIGASGARILITLLAAMEDRDAKKGVASLCIGGGEGIAMCVERA